MNQLKDFYTANLSEPQHDVETDDQADPNAGPVGYWDEDFCGWKRRDLVISAVIMFGLLALLWIVYAISLGVPQIKIWGGIVPRTAHGLIGLVTSGFLHAGWQHITSNSGPFLILGYLLCIRGRLEFLFIMLIEMFISNMIIWIAGRPNVSYIGASGFIFCWFGYLCAVAAVERPVRWSSVITTVVVVFLYAGLIFGVLPQTTEVDGGVIAWETHLVSFIVGALASVFFYVVYPRLPACRQKCPCGPLPAIFAGATASNQQPEVDELDDVIGDDRLSTDSDSDESSGFLSDQKNRQTERDRTSVQVEHWGNFSLG